MTATGMFAVLLASFCINTSKTQVQKHECAAYFGNCIANYNTEKEAFEKCKDKWEKVKNEIK